VSFAEDLRTAIEKVHSNYEKAREGLDLISIGSLTMKIIAPALAFTKERCKSIKCTKKCEFGYKLNELKSTTPLCPSCDCEEDPCKVRIPQNKKAVTITPISGANRTNLPNSHVHAQSVVLGEILA
jgi:hypothetical protein